MNQATGPHTVNVLIGQIEEASSRLLRTAAGLSDQQASEQSALPGWSRGHVLTHIARNADGLRNLLIWAGTGVVTPQYPSLQARAEQIEAGAGRPAAELAADVAESAGAFTAQARELPDDAWQTEVRGSRGQPHPAWFTLHRRLSEVEIHHCDLAAGYQPANWPAWFVAEQLYRVTGEFASNPATPAVLLTDAGTGRQYLLRAAVESGREADAPGGSGQAPPELAVTGPGYLLLAWLLGRHDGAGLAADPAVPLPAIPPFS